MRDWDPKRLWDELLQAFLGRDEEDDEEVGDPTLLLHLMFTAPLLLALLALARR
jgi:hypothetical protein